jgi:hypothetical protein
LWITIVGALVSYLDDFFEVYASNDTRVNILSFSKVEELYLITYEPFVGFIVHQPDRDILFKKKGKMHRADAVVIGGHCTSYAGVH